MRNHYFRCLLFAFLCGASGTLFSQNIAINTSGNSPYTSAILDLSNHNTVGTVGFLPPYVTLTALGTFGLSGTAAQSNGIIVYNTGGAVAAGLYFWNNSVPTWVAMSGGGSISGGTTNYLARWLTATTLGIGVAQDNGTGVSISSTVLVPANKLDVNGSEAVGTYAGTAAPANGMIISGEVGIGNSAPASSAIIDFTNTKATGATGAPLLWCMNPSPSVNITPAVYGEEVYNTTTGCFNFYNGTTWLIESCPCNAALGAPTIAATCSQSFQGSSITYSSSISSGGTFLWTATATTGVPSTSANGLSSITVTWPSGGAGTGTVGLTFTNACGVMTASQSVTINANPILSGTAALIVASAGNMYSCSQAGATYAWSSSSTYGVIVGSTTGQTVSVTSANSAGTFTLTCNVSFGACSQILTYPVTVNCPAAASITGTSPLLVNSAGNVYTCTEAGATYAWSSNSTYGTIVGSNTGQTVSVTSANSAGTFTLTCIATYGACVQTLTFPVAVNCPATPTITGTNPINESSSGNIFTCSLAGATSYSWSSNSTYGTIVGSTTNQTISVTAAASAGTFTLTCNVTYASCTYTITSAVSVTCPHGTITLAYSASMQTWTVPSCINTITVVATAAQGVACNGNAAGKGAIVTATVTVVGGDVLDIVTGQKGTSGSASGGGGGTFVWDNASTTNPLVVAGGGGGAGTVSAGIAGATTAALTNLANDGNAGAGGNGGTGGTATKTGPGGGGGGWNSAGTLATQTNTSGQGGFGLAGAFAGGNGGNNGGGSGGYGGGGGSGYSNNSFFGGGGGGGGYSGGGGGNAASTANQYGGQGGSSGYYNGVIFTDPVTVTQTSNTNGKVVITY